MKMRNKGKVHPSPSPRDNSNNTLSVLSLLPAAILTIASVLSLEDREVLAYMVTRSMKPTTPFGFSKKNSKKMVTHKPPVFDCECFDCYTNYWFRWDSSPNRELIHQAIEAFEEHLSKNEIMSKRMRNKKKLKTFRDGVLKTSSGVHSFLEKEEKTLAEAEDDFVHVLPENEVLVPESADFSSENEVEEVEEEFLVKEVAAPVPETTVVVRGAAANGGHKGLARKVLPDVLGLFNSRLWNLWSPNV